ncbi:MAG TPA: hypothetical protein VJ728_15705, partial [Candidatus Binataceae bacterium]|nr:hypothetical protein [Candidatus Binataceae bacterium]
LIGASRKSFIRKISGNCEAGIELGTNAANAVAIASGASLLRVHDPASAVITARMAAAIAAAGRV